MNSLDPAEDIHRLLLSSTCRFVGEIKRDSWSLRHAWPGFGDGMGMARWEETPISRYAFVFTFRQPAPGPRPGTSIPDYAYMGEVFSSYLSVLFGKRFDSHGVIESHGMFQLPNLGTFEDFCQHRLPQNRHRPRADFGFPLNLDETRRLSPLLERDEAVGDRRFDIFNTASRFYARALRAAERDPEVAYLHLITAGEVLAEGSGIDAAELMDDEAAEALRRISDEMDGGDRLARLLSGRLRQLKRKFTFTILRSLDDEFFERSEHAETWGRLQQAGIADRLKSAYDLRSRYVHVGVPFGGWVAPTSLRDVQIGRPVVADNEFSHILATAPTYLGLERIIRYCLIKTLGGLGADISIAKALE